MKIGLLITGILLVIGVVIEHSVESNVITQVKNLVDLQKNEMAQLSQISSNLPYAASGNIGLDPSNLEIVSPSQIQQLQKMLEFGTFGTGIMGVGFMTYGLVSKTKKRFLSSSALDTLKMRLAKGEISKEDFDRMKDDVA